jgi:hypothetical protein
MFEPMAMNQQQFGAMPSARRQGTAQSVAGALVNQLGKKQDTPPADPYKLDDPSTFIAEDKPKWLEDSANTPAPEQAMAPPAWAPRDDAPAPSQVASKLDNPIMNQKPETSFSSSENPFQAAAMADEFGKWGTPEARDHAKGADMIKSLAMAYLGARA